MISEMRMTHATEMATILKMLNEIRNAAKPKLT